MSPSLSTPVSPIRSAVPAVQSATTSGQRIEVIDWLRGVAVVLMIQAHAYDAWLAPSEKIGPAYTVIRHLSGLPSRLFLLLVGVSAAIRFEGQLSKGVPAQKMRAQACKRGLEIVGLAYLFRLQEHVLAGFRGGWEMLFRIDILNAIGASLILVGLIATPRGGRRQIGIAIFAAAVFLGFGPLIGPWHFPAWLPRPLTSYIGGQRPMCWFPMFPWAAWALLGVAIGHIWVRESTDGHRQARCFLLSGLLGVAITSSVIGIRAINPYIIRYPSELVQQMGPGSFFFRLGIIGAIAAVGWLVTRLSGDRFSPMKQLGRTSLLIYWVHVDLCYGGIARPVRGKLGIPGATLGIVLLTALMLALSMVKTRHGKRIRALLVARWERLRMRM